MGAQGVNQDLGIVSGAAAAGPRIGPNSVLQTLRALRELERPELAQLIPLRAELPVRFPAGMIPEAWFVRLIQVLRASLPTRRAEAVLRRSGAYTADYVSRNRIPAPLRLLLRLLPVRLGIPLLLAAFRRHAWTFAGGGRFHAEGRFPGTIVLSGCPTCRADSAADLHGHAGAYYEAAFEGLLSLASPKVRVREVACQSSHDPDCRFQISLTDPL
jgi:divinyl protochlorophyllide a 8-vinyl-reductase